MVKDIIRIGYRELKKSPQINLSVASFIPKPHTPFQWDAMEPEDKLREKHSFLKEQLKKYTFVQFKEHSLKSSLLEAVFSRGDRRLASVLIQAWKYGARFDSWTDCFDFSIWQKAFERQGIAVSDYLRSIEHSAVLPWEHIDCGIKKSHLLDEWKLSRKEEKSSKCRDRVCSQCRGCDFPGFEPKPAQFPCPVPVTIWHPLGNKDDDTVHRYRVRYQKTGPARFLSHIDTSTILQRGLRRSGIKALYSRGFHPKMQLSFPPALPLGMEGQNEVFEFRSHYVFPDETVSLVNTSLPGGIWLTAVDRIKFDSPSLTKSIQELVYSVRLDSETIRRGLEKHTMDMDEVISLILAHDRDSGPGAVKEISLNSKKHRLILVYSFQPGLSIRPQSILEELFSIPHPSFYLAREDIRLS
jgi:radical SAM-linked protein